ncbi:AEC family transporter [Dryocola clanedunensis]|uniref:AEC family transporter n=1 Tax=Cedecea sulfonylureivorans TaxID=3051154 RepID=UPI00192878C1|nr:AEC family transporter [Cedecea sulfonylureivorans]
MESRNFILIPGAILPVVVTVLLGYISGKRNDFAWEQAGAINKLVMLYALPLSIFSNMVMTPRSVVMSMGPVAAAIVVALIISFVLPLIIIRYIFKRDLSLSTLQALAIGSPAVPFIGTSVLAFLFGTVSASLITVSSITQNVFQLPLVMILMSWGAGDKKNSSFIGSVIDAVKQPVVWSPVLALLLVILNVHIPETVAMALGLLGKATGGLALFSAGIVLYSRSILITVPTIITVIARNIIVPGACFFILSALGLSMEQIKQVVLTMAIPVGSIAIIIAMQYKTGEQEMASTMALSIILSILTMGAFIFLTF